MRSEDRARQRRLQREGLLRALNTGTPVASPARGPLDSPAGRDASAAEPFLTPLASPIASPACPLAHCGPPPATAVRSVRRLLLINSSESVLGAAVDEAYAADAAPAPLSVQQVAGKLSRAISRAALATSARGGQGGALLEPMLASARRSSSSRALLRPTRTSLADLPTEVLVMVLGEFGAGELATLRRVCLAWLLLVDDLCRRAYDAAFGSLVDPRHFGAAWPSLLREAQRRQLAARRWPEDAAWLAARGMQRRWPAAGPADAHWPAAAAHSAMLAAAHNPLAGPLYALLEEQLAARRFPAPQWHFVWAAALLGLNLPLARRIGDEYGAAIQPCVQTIALRFADAALRVRRLPPFLGDTPSLRSLVVAAVCVRSDDDALPVLRYALAFGVAPGAALSYRDWHGAQHTMLDLMLRAGATPAALAVEVERAGRPSLCQVLPALPAERPEAHWWLLAPPHYSWRELFEACARSGTAALLALLRQRAPDLRLTSRLLRLALRDGNRPVVDALMPHVRVRERPVLGAAIHGELYDVGRALALRGAKQTEVFQGRPLVLLLVSKPFLPPDARALLDLLLAPPDPPTRTWLHTVLNVPHEGELPLCAAMAGDDALYKVTRLLQAGARADHSDSAGNTPLLLSLKAGAALRPVTELLLAQGASPNGRNAADESPITVALAQADAALLARLLDAGALPHVSARGWTVLHTWLEQRAAEWDATRAIVDALVPRFLPPDARTHDTGDSLLHFAVRFRRRHALQALLLRGASPDLPNASNVTPLQLAVRMRHPPATITLLKEHSHKRSACVVA